MWRLNTQNNILINPILPRTHLCLFQTVTVAVMACESLTFNYNEPHQFSGFIRFNIRTQWEQTTPTAFLTMKPVL